MKKLLKKLIAWLKDITSWDVESAAEEILDRVTKDENVTTSTQQDDDVTASPPAVDAADSSSAGTSGTAGGVDFAELDWCWGGFDGSKAAAVDGVRISGLKTTTKGMTYKWEAGGCEKLGAANRSDYTQTLACLFCWDGAKWRGGKFDWISTSRTSRDFSNLYGYNGWDRSAYDNAKAVAFCIVSRDGRKRTNVITCGR